jgi:hypothetical protein
VLKTDRMVWSSGLGRANHGVFFRGSCVTFPVGVARPCPKCPPMCRSCRRYDSLARTWLGWPLFERHAPRPLRSSPCRPGYECLRSRRYRRGAIYYNSSFKPPFIGQSKGVKALRARPRQSRRCRASFPAMVHEGCLCYDGDVGMCIPGAEYACLPDDIGSAFDAGKIPRHVLKFRAGGLPRAS